MAEVLQSLPPHRRAQVLLQEMAGLTVRLLDLAGSKSWQGGHQKNLFPPFLAGAAVPAEAMAANSTKDVLTLLGSHQTLLFEAVAEITELQDLEQDKQRIADEVAAKDAAVREFAKRVRDAEQVLEMTLEEFDEFRKPKASRKEEKSEVIDGIGLGKINVEELIAYAHRISYTTFAPPEHAAGQPLRGALAPAPQDEQLRASQLYQFSDMDVGLPRPLQAVQSPSRELVKVKPEPAAAVAATATATATPIPGDWKPPPMPPGWKPGDPLPALPEVPPGWKPGDPIVLLPKESPSTSRVASVVPLPSSMTSVPAPPQAAASGGGVIHVPFVQLDLNPELEDDYMSDYSEDDQSSGDEA